MFIGTTFQQLGNERQVRYRPVIEQVKQVECDAGVTTAHFCVDGNEPSSRNEALTNVARNGANLFTNRFTIHVGTGSNLQFLVSARVIRCRTVAGLTGLNALNWALKAQMYVNNS